MKKILCLLMVVSFIGCASVKITSSEESKAYKTGKAAGLFVALYDEEFASAALPYAEGLLKASKTGEITARQVAQALSFISGKFKGDAKWRAIYGMFIEEVGVEVEMGKINDKLIEAMEGFVEGLKIAGEELC